MTKSQKSFWVWKDQRSSHKEVQKEGIIYTKLETNY
jgi:hypothetical protein